MGGSPVEGFVGSSVGRLALERAQEDAERAVDLAQLRGGERREEIARRGEEGVKTRFWSASPSRVSATSEPRPSLGSGTRSISPASSRRFRIFVMPPDERSRRPESWPGVSSKGAPERRSAPSTV